VKHPTRDPHGSLDIDQRRYRSEAREE
jgi:hypothetical protein